VLVTGLSPSKTCWLPIASAIMIATVMRRASGLFELLLALVAGGAQQCGFDFG